MPLTFKSQATGDLVMVKAHAEALLKVLGKTAFDKGIIEVADMPAALSTLRQLSDEPLHSEREDEDAAEEDNLQSKSAPAFADEFVSLHKRAVPLIRMIEQAQAEGKPIVWGV